MTEVFEIDPETNAAIRRCRRQSDAEPRDGANADHHASAYGRWLPRLTRSGPSSVLHSFSGSDGAVPLGGLVVGPDGALYGTTSEAGRFGFGTAFRITMDDASMIGATGNTVYIATTEGEVKTLGRL